MLAKVRYVVREATAPGAGREEAGVIVEVIGRNKVRVRTNGGHGVVEAINTVVPARLGLPVRIAHVGGAWRVTGLDYLTLQDPGQYHYVPQHAEAHTFNAAGGGDDVIWIEKIQLTPLLVAPTSPPSRKVRVLPGTYYSSNGTLNRLSVTTILDLEPYFADTTKIALISMDTEQGTLVVDASEEQPVPRPGCAPLAVVRLRPGAPRVTWDDILDARDMPPTLQSAVFGTVARFLCIVRLSQDGSRNVYELSSSGLQRALSDAQPGDTVVVPIALDAAISVTVPDSVVLILSGSRVAASSGNGIAVLYCEG